MIEFIVGTSYHPPLGTQKRGHNEYYFLSRCNRWHVREGNFGTMIVTDRQLHKLHVIEGKMPEVQAFIAITASATPNRGHDR